jgi:hypothetical protein
LDRLLAWEELRRKRGSAIFEGPDLMSVASCIHETLRWVAVLEEQDLELTEYHTDGGVVKYYRRKERPYAHTFATLSLSASVSEG